MNMNHDRYNSMTEKAYNKRGISYYLMRKPADRVLIPYASHIRDKKVLEVGIGFGYYTKYYLDNHNKAKGADINSELGKNIGVEIVAVAANRLKDVFNEKFDYIVSFFMTEYLSYSELGEFIMQSVSLLDKGGKFATTIILRKGIGRLYIMLAMLKGIKKYNYSIKEIKTLVQNKHGLSIRITHLDSVMRIPFAVLLEIEKK